MHSNTFCTTDGKQFSCSFWSDVIHLKTAQALATFEQDYFAGMPAITSNSFGKGTSYYISTVPDQIGMDWLIDEICHTANVKPVVSNAPPGIEILQRENEKTSWLILLNHLSDRTTVPLEQECLDLLTGMKAKDSFELEPNGVAILQLQ
jgi:beta-galactosidase